MRSNKAWYWLAAGVLALGVNGAYQDGQLGWAHALVNHLACKVEMASARGMRFVTLAEVMLGRTPEQFGRTEGVFEKIQTQALNNSLAKAQQQIAMARVRQQLAEAKVQQKLDMAQMKMDKVRMISIDGPGGFHNCPGFSKVIVHMPDLPKVDLSNLPGIDLSDLPGSVDVSVHKSSHDPI